MSGQPGRNTDTLVQDLTFFTGVAAGAWVADWRAVGMFGVGLMIRRWWKSRTADQPLSDAGETSDMSGP